MGAIGGKEAEQRPAGVPGTLAEALSFVESGGMRAPRRDRVRKAVGALCRAMGCEPQDIGTDAPSLRAAFDSINPRAHGIDGISLHGHRVSLATALTRLGAIDAVEVNRARAHPDWRPLMTALRPHKYLLSVLTPFANWCAANNVAPAEVDSRTVETFVHWLRERTIHSCRPDLERRLPGVWNKAGRRIEAWPRQQLEVDADWVRRPLPDWSHLSPGFRDDLKHYLEFRAAPGLRDNPSRAPLTPLSKTSLRTHFVYLRRAASILVRHGYRPGDIASLADLLEPAAFRTVLRHFHAKARDGPSPYAKQVANILLQAARYHAGISPERLTQLEHMAAKLPTPRQELTAQSRTVLRRLESPRLRRKLLGLPEALMEAVKEELGGGKLRYVDAQIAVAIDMLLVAPLTASLLAALNWRRHFREADDGSDRLTIRIDPDAERANRKTLIYELPGEVSDRVRWYRSHVLPKLHADGDGNLFVLAGGAPKARATLLLQLRQVIEAHMGFNITTTQFRHFAANLLLERNPEDFESLRALLGYAGRTTVLRYAELARRVAGREYSDFVVRKRDHTKAEALRTAGSMT